MFRVLRSLLGRTPEPSEGVKVLEITSDNRVIMDEASIVNSPAAQEHIAAVRNLQLPLTQVSGK